MARRTRLCSTCNVLGLLLLAGCQGGKAPAPIPVAVQKPTPPVAPATAPVAPAPKPPLEITPGSSTITADDAGLQLLAARKEAGSVHDLTGAVKWSVEPAGLAEIEQGGISGRWLPATWSFRPRLRARHARPRSSSSRGRAARGISATTSCRS